MKVFFNIFLFVVLCEVYGIPVFASNERVGTSLSGKIIDKETKEGMPGVSIYFSDLKTGTLSKGDGSYVIDNLPSSKVLIKVTMVGYTSITETIDLSVTTTQDFIMERSVTEVTEVVITGLSQATEQKRTPTPISVVSHEQLLQNSSSNIIDATTRTPGVSQISSGAAISKPVIRGLGYNRVVVVNDGIRQEGQQWGDEHGIEIDEYSVNKVEILKGPASLAYGSDAMGGVVNMISFPTLPVGAVNGRILGNYQTNNGMAGYSGNVAGNLNGFVFDMRLSGKQAHAYQNKYDGYVLGSRFREMNYGGILGLNRSWGFSHLHLSSYHLETEIVQGERDSANGQFIKEVSLNDTAVGDAIASDSDLKNYAIGMPRQDVVHYKAVLNNSVVIKNYRLNVILGCQQNNRKEFADVLDPSVYELFFLLNSLHYDVRLIFPERNKYLVSVGFNGMKQTSQNKGEEFLIPEYKLFDAGGYATLKKSGEKLDLHTGVRYDFRAIESEELLLDTLGNPTSAEDPVHVQKFKPLSRDISSGSGSLGVSYQFSATLFSKLNISRGFRAPSIGELASNGVHEGTVRYQIGNSALKPENSLQFDLAIGLNSEHVSGEISLFSNSIKNYIYSEKLSSAFGGDSIVDLLDPVPAYKFIQGDVNLTGGEILVDFHPHPFHWLHFENSFSVVNAVQKNATDSTKYLPFIPAPKFTSELRAEKEKLGKLFRDAYAMAGIDIYLKQDRVYSAFGTETETPRYVLVNLGIGGDVVNKSNRKICSLYLSVNNLADVAYQSHLSRLKYGDMNNVTSRTGVYNMGRNISFKLIVPFELKKPKEWGLFPV